MKLIASLLTIVTGVAAWMFLQKNKPALARLSAFTAKAPKVPASKAKVAKAKTTRARRIVKGKQKAHATPHKRNGMTAHSAH